MGRQEKQIVGCVVLTMIAIRRVLFLLLTIAGLIIIFNLGKQTLFLWKATQRIEDARDRVEILGEANEYMRQNLSYYRSEEFVEREARNRLNLVRPGEVVVLLPSPTPQPEEESTETTPNWKRWWRLFFD